MEAVVPIHKNRFPSKLFFNHLKSPYFLFIGISPPMY
ncbi:hypothetical protein [Enterocloster phage PMBT24]|uniref:Uncharacterized protein n=1 Tax=Enterocloster phage PMBT24 TaxID=3025413 RepID=A0AAT9TS17_9CAUD|nr:hypothetical protein [Enterocloster phage PMBT24]